MERIFQLVELQDDEQVMNGDVLADPVVYENYDAAIDELNTRIITNGGEPIRQPRQNKAVRVELKRKSIEVWVITRTDDVTK